MKTLARPRDRAELLQRLSHVRVDSVRKWGTMSAHEMVCHLSDAFRMAIGEKQVSPASSLAHRTMIKWIALYTPVRWPSGIQTRPEIDQRLGAGTRPSEFARDVAELETLIELVGQRKRAAWPVHPIFGWMSERAWLRWAYLHPDHHFRQFGA